MADTLAPDGGSGMVKIIRHLRRAELYDCRQEKTWDVYKEKTF